MYIIDYQKQLVKKFNKSDLAFFLNQSYAKNRYIFCDSKTNLIKVLHFSYPVYGNFKKLQIRKKNA